VLHLNQGHCHLAARRHYKEKREAVFIMRSHGLDDHMNKVLTAWRAKLGLQNRALIKRAPGSLLDRLLNRHITLACRYIDGAIVSSSLDRDFLIEHHNVPRARVACIHQAPADVFLSTPPNPMSDVRSRKVLFIGNAYWKGVHAAAEAMNGLLLERPDLEFTWVCHAPARPQAAALLTPHARARTVFPDWMPQDRLVGLFDSHGIFLCPSLFEGFCKVFLEAMSRGLCVIATPTGGMKDIIEDGKNGVLVDFNCPTGIATCIDQVTHNVELASALSQEAATCARRYTWDRTARETEEFYQRLREMPRRWAEEGQSYGT